MSSLLWKAFYEDDVDTFRQLLATAGANVRTGGPRGGGAVAVIGSPGALGTSPTVNARGKRSQATPTHLGHSAGLTKAAVNLRDGNGMTLLHHAASSTAESAFDFASALVEHPLIDLYIQDHESGWTALHRAFYFGNVTIARLILERDAGDALGQTTGHVHQTIGIVKVKDREGYGPLDLFAATIKDRTLRPQQGGRARSGSGGSEDYQNDTDTDTDMAGRADSRISFNNVCGDEVLTFGSNKNVSLGFGDEDDRHFPERVTLRRPEHLLRRFYKEHLRQVAKKRTAYDPHFVSQADLAAAVSVNDIPWMIRSRPLTIQNVFMAKFHTAVLTTDPESNLYMCGHGQGGRLGLGDERTRFNFVCVEGGALAGKKVDTVALGQNHSLALSDEGEVFSWGNNGFGQLGYNISKSNYGNDDPVSVVPRQIFGPLKRETVTGIAASRIHSVAFTGASLYTFGKNEGQLGIVDSDARSLEIQVTPRKVAASLFSSPITSASAIDTATICLLENHDVWIFANYGYAKVQFPLDGFSNYFLRQSFLVTTYDNVQNHIVKITSAGEHVCALSSRGEVFTAAITQNLDNSVSSSTTNPSKIRGAITVPQKIWSPKRSNMAARDVEVDADGSIILSAEEGSVWKRTKRAKLKNASAAGAGEYRPKDYKFSRIPGLTRVLGVRASAHGAYAAIKRDCDVTKTQIVVEEPRLWEDLLPLLSLKRLYMNGQSSEDIDRPRFWQASPKTDDVQLLKRAILSSEDVEADLAGIVQRCFSDSHAKHDALLATSTSDLQIPVHRFILTARSRVLRRGFRDICGTSTFTIPDLAVSEIDSQGRTVVKFQGLDILAVVDLALYLYTDQLIDFWNLTRNSPKMAYRYRQIRTELMKVASKIELIKLEPAVRQMSTPVPCLDLDFALAFQDLTYFFDGDITVELEDDEIAVHSALVCARCPFFEGLFMGRAGGRWLAGRAHDDEIKIDLKHLSAKTFKIVLRHMYTDVGEDIFDDVISADLDEFLDVILDVLSAANELMLDRLSQICQAVLGKFVNVRNVSWMLNAISPSSVHEFKDAGLEYLCLSLEAMLQGHHLNDLDEDLQLDLDQVVQENQLACMPFAKSGRAEMLLHERYPELVTIIQRNRQVKIDAITLRSKFHFTDQYRSGAVDDEMMSSPSQHAARKQPANNRTEQTQPALKAKASSKDMMFAMDEEEDRCGPRSSESPPLLPEASIMLSSSIGPSSPPAAEVWYNARGKVISSSSPAAQSPTPASVTPGTPRSPILAGRTPSSTTSPWQFASLPGAKSDMKEIMAQASSGRTSSLSQALAAAKSSQPSSLSGPVAKRSQKDRKRMQQAQHGESVTANLSTAPALPSAAQAGPAQVSVGKSASPWQAITAQKIPVLKDIIDKHDKGSLSSPASSSKPIAPRAASTPQLTMRQTVANAKAAVPRRPNAGLAASGLCLTPCPPDGKSHSTSVRGRPALAHSATQPTSSSSSSTVPHSIRHRPLPVEPTLQLSMSDILAQQQAEKDVVKEAVAKRDLQDIQAEQEFQEWWDKESARVQEAERRQSNPPRGPHRSNRGRGGGRSGGKASRGQGRDGNTKAVGSQ